MNNKYYEHIPLGDSIPLDNPYAFSVSMPTVQDVIDYEEETLEIKDKIKSAYPRIIFHPYVLEILELAKDLLGLKDKYLFLLPGIKAGKIVATLSNTSPEFIEFHGYIIAAFNNEEKLEIKEYYNFMKHCGYMVFDREAEDLLRKLGSNIPVFTEEVIENDSKEVILNILEQGYESPNILLANCGMNAIYGGFEVVKNIALESGKGLFILFGWAYSDTIQILKKCSKDLIIISDINNTEALESVLKERGGEVAGLYMETVSNPLIAVPDFPLVYNLSIKYNFPVLVDNTFATPWNVDINPYCDLIFESLTKFASGQGDIMAGAVILPLGSRLKKSILGSIEELLEPLYIRSCNRLAFSIKEYKNRVLAIGENTKKVVKYIEQNSRVKELFSVKDINQHKNWLRIARNKDFFCGVISVVFNCELKKVYDELKLPKGPSLGAEFPIVMTYTLLAHYYETKTTEGLEYLKEAGLSPNLLRVSVGLDNPTYLLKAIDKVLVSC